MTTIETSQVKVTQVKSTIAGLRKQKATLQTLGLGKIGRSVVVDYDPRIKGMLQVVAHLVTVEEVR